MSGKILPLPESVRSQLRSGVAITSVSQCVEELVLNSLDAGATCLAVRVDISLFRIQVVDNGSGICYNDLKVLGSRHATSKCHTLQDLTSNLAHYGFRGEALASIVDLAAIIDITTRSHSSTETYTKLFTYGKEKYVSTSQTHRPSVGTTITIQDFMYNMPVRRKLIKEAIDIESIRIRLESFALMHPKVSFSLRNDNSNAIIFQASKSNCLMSTFMQLFGSDRAQGLAEVYHSVDPFTISGYVSTQPHLTKALQFVYVNKRVILKTKIHKLMNELLSRSSIISSRLHPTTPVPGKTPSSPAKGLKLYSVFVLNIECPLNVYDICLDPHKTLVEFKEWDKLLLCIEEMIVKFIQEENLVISLDERFRRSGRELLVEEEDSPPVPHSSQVLLQVFSLKRSGDPKGTIDAPREKYGRTLCIQDNLSAVHSQPVRRAGKRMEVKVPCEWSNLEDCDDYNPLDGDDDNDEEFEDNNDDDFVECKKVKNSEKKLSHISLPDRFPGSRLQKIDDVRLSNVTERKDKNNSSVEEVKRNLWSAKDDCNKFKTLSHVDYIRSIIAKHKESNQQLQNKCHSQDQDCKSETSRTDSLHEEIADDHQSDDNSLSGSDSSSEKEDCTSELNTVNEDVASTDVALSEWENNMDSPVPENLEESNTSDLSDGGSVEKSSLQEFKALYNAEMQKIDTPTSCATPEVDMRGTPLIPPPIEKLIPDHSAGLHTSRCSFANISSSAGSNRKKSLCRDLSEKRSICRALSGRKEGKSVCRALSERTEGKSLCRALSEGMIKHQKKMKSLQSLQKFEFRKGRGNSGNCSDHQEKPSKGCGLPSPQTLLCDKKAVSSREDESNLTVSSREDENNLTALTRLAEFCKPSKESHPGNCKVLCAMNESNFRVTTTKSLVREVFDNQSSNQISSSSKQHSSMTETTCIEVCAPSEKTDLGGTDGLEKSSPSKSQVLSKMQKFKYSKNYPLVNGNKSNFVETVETVPVPFENQVLGNETAVGDDSFSFEPVLSAFTEREECTENYKSNDSIFHCQTKGVLHHDSSVPSVQAACLSSKPVGSVLGVTCIDLIEPRKITDKKMPQHVENAQPQAQLLLKTQAEQPVGNSLYPDDRLLVNQECCLESKHNIRRDNNSDIETRNNELLLVASAPFPSSATYDSHLEEPPIDLCLDKHSLPSEAASPEISSTELFEVGSDILQVKSQDLMFHYKDAGTDVPGTGEVILQEIQGFTPVISGRLACDDMEKKQSFLKGTDMCERISNVTAICSSSMLVNTSLTSVSDSAGSSEHRCASHQLGNFGLNPDSCLVESENNIKPDSCLLESENGISVYSNSFQSNGEKGLSSFSTRGTTSRLLDATEYKFKHKFNGNRLHCSDSLSSRFNCSLSMDDRGCSNQSAAETQNADNESNGHSSLSQQISLMNSSAESIVGAVSFIEDNVADSTSHFKEILDDQLSNHISEFTSRSADTNDKVNGNLKQVPEVETDCSPSLHFTQLTLPDVADSLSFQRSELKSSCGVLGLSTPLISSFSCSIEKSECPGKVASTIGCPAKDETCITSGEKSSHHELNEAFTRTGVADTPLLVTSDLQDGNTSDICFSESDSLLIEAERQLLKDLEKRQSVGSDDTSSDIHIQGAAVSRVENDVSRMGKDAESEESHIADGWKESFDSSGRRIYVNLRTGNTSYDLPVAKVSPEWMSSQPLGAPLLKVPLTHEPDYIPFGKDHPRQDFTLSHGFSAFMSWKKRRETMKLSNDQGIIGASAQLVVSSEKKGTDNHENIGASAQPVVSSDEKRTLDPSNTYASMLEGSEAGFDDPALSPIPRDALLDDIEAESASVKWTDKPSFANENSPTNVAQICQMWEAPDFAMDADVLQSEHQVITGEGMLSAVRGGPVRVYNIVHPYKFSREMLLSCKVLGQLDNKFIACSIKHTPPDEPDSPTSHLLILFDQHAVHERIRLETIIEENYEEADSGRRVIRSSIVTPPLSLMLPDNEVRLMVAYSDYFIQRGLHFCKISTSKVSFHAIPNCLVAKEASEIRHRRCQTASAIVESIVQEMCHKLHTTGGVVGNIPKPLLHVLNSQACRGAVKFGDELSLSQCQELITSLSSCQLPFQCAHGRPSIVPVVNVTHLAKLDKHVAKPNIKKLVAAMHHQDSV